jgi:hypothetical protein
MGEDFQPRWEDFEKRCFSHSLAASCAYEHTAIEVTISTPEDTPTKVTTKVVIRVFRDTGLPAFSRRLTFFIFDLSFPIVD